AGDQAGDGAAVPSLPGVAGALPTSALTGSGSQGAGNQGEASQGDGAGGEGQQGQTGQAAPAGPLLPDQPIARALAFASDRMAEGVELAVEVGSAFADVPSVLDWVQRQLDTAIDRTRWLGILEALAIGLGGALVLYAVVVRLLHPLRRRLGIRGEGATWIGRLFLVIGRLILDAVPLVVLGLAVSALLTAIDATRLGRLVTLTLTNAVLIHGWVAVAARALLTPRTPALRLYRMGDETAAYLYVWVRRLSAVIVYGFFAGEIFFYLGAPPAVRETIVNVVGLAIGLMTAVFLLQSRRPVARFLRGSGRTTGPLAASRRRVAEVWHLLAIAYIGVVYVIWMLEVPGGFGFLLRSTILSVVVVLAARLAMDAIGRAMRRGFRVSAEMRESFPGLEARANRYLPVLQRLANFLVVVLAVLALLQIWRLGGFSWFTTPSGRGLASSAVSIVFVLAVLFALWEGISAAIQRYLQRTDETGERVVASARARTLLPLLRTTVMIVLGTIGTLVILSELGINIAPLLAGAGVVGIAIGFGAQTLVQDVITGLFILLEDTISVGDVVDVGGHTGIVEGLSIRAIRLRDLSGNVHTVPFSQVSTVLNMTKEFSYYVFDIGVAYREDTDQVTRLIREVGDDLQSDPDFGAQILEPVEIFGVDRFADSAVVVKARIKTRPIQQWYVGREFNRRLKKRFDAEGVEIPFPHVTVYFGEDKEGRAPAARLSLDDPRMVEALEAERARRAASRESADSEKAAEPHKVDAAQRLPGAEPTIGGGSDQGGER
ncbi:MAG: mechanosensitive ion channel, partial [Azospirillaceae bacterium]